MRITAFDTRLPKTVGDDSIAMYHYFMFHGFASREGEDEIDAPVAHLENDVRSPLEIVRTGRIVPDVFAPSVNPVVSEKVRERLKGWPRVEFVPVVFTRLFDAHFAAGDFSFYDKKHGYYARDELKFIERLPDILSFHETIGNYYELLVPRVSTVMSEFSGDSMRTIRIDETFEGAFGREKVEFSVSEEMLHACPLLRQWVFITTPQTFEILKPFLDLDYYTVVEKEI